MWSRSGRPEEAAERWAQREAARVRDADAVERDEVWLLPDRHRRKQYSHGSLGAEVFDVIASGLCLVDGSYRDDLLKRGVTKNAPRGSDVFGSDDAEAVHLQTSWLTGVPPDDDMGGL